MKKRIIVSALACMFMLCAGAQNVTFSDIQNWTTSELKSYVGQTVTFTQPVYICNNYSGLVASMHRQMSPTNQATPLSAEYNTIVSQNSKNTFTLTGLSGNHRMGEVIYGMKAKVNSTGSVQYISSTKIVGTRTDLEKGIPSVDLVYDEDGDSIVTHDLLVCAANLEYYLTEQFGNSGQGPSSAAQHEKQRAKVSAGLSKIAADIYGLVEIQQGQGAIAEIAADLTQKTGRHYAYINDGGSASGTYTKSGYVYCSDVVTPYGKMKDNDEGVRNRKKMQAFTINGTNERFIFSLNHFKAKSGTASGADANQNDGQGTFNASRVKEARSVLTEYEKNMIFYGDSDILVMGDLNAYAMEDPITALKEGGMLDLHRYFHADSSYSYTYHGQAGYLDHALCNRTMLRQITGMAAYHINSDESDNYTYDKSSDATMFRYSDHDPVLVGLKIGAQIKTALKSVEEKKVMARIAAGQLHIYNADGGYCVVGSLDGRMVHTSKVAGDYCTLDFPMQGGMYFVTVYPNNKLHKNQTALHQKFLITGNNTSTIILDSEEE